MREQILQVEADLEELADAAARLSAAASSWWSSPFPAWSFKEAEQHGITLPGNEVAAGEVAHSVSLIGVSGNRKSSRSLASGSSAMVSCTEDPDDSGVGIPEAPAGSGRGWGLQTLTNDEVYALTAYILALNKIIGENDVINAQGEQPWSVPQPPRHQPAAEAKLGTGEAGDIRLVLDKRQIRPASSARPPRPDFVSPT